MAKLNQIIAVANGRKTGAQRTFTDIYQKLGKNELFMGITRTYRPDTDDGETLPQEVKLLQMKCVDAIREAKDVLTELFDVTLTQDFANTQAKADVVVDDRVILSDVPVTYLLFLEKQLTDINTFVNKLPTLDPAEQWAFDSNSDSYRTSPIETNRTKKVLRNHVKAEATDKHPAQVEVYSEDVKVGEWETVKFSGAIPSREKNEIISRIGKLSDAVKFARETANNLDVERQTAGQSVLSYIFG